MHDLYTLVIGDRAYSSWSLRGWLMFDAFGIPVTTLRAQLYTDELPKLLRDFAPAKTAPTMRTPDEPAGFLCGLRAATRGFGRFAAA